METATVHPLQAFADLITIKEYADAEIAPTRRPKVVLTWAPHCRALPQAVPNSFAQWMNAADVDFVITHPEGYELDPKFVGNARVEYDDAAHMAVTNNGKFMHCLPVRRGLIVTDDVIESPNSIVIPEAANREISCSVVIKRMLETM